MLCAGSAHGWVRYHPDTGRDHLRHDADAFMFTLNGGPETYYVLLWIQNNPGTRPGLWCFCDEVIVELVIDQFDRLTIVSSRFCKVPSYSTIKVSNISQRRASSPKLETSALVTVFASCGTEMTR